jgi:hypothetical protein
VLLQHSAGLHQPLPAPTAQPSVQPLLSSANEIGLAFPGGPVADLLNGKWRVRYLGLKAIGHDRCVGLEVIHREQSGFRAHLWFDPSRGYLLRRAKQYQNGQLWSDLVAFQPREWAPGIFVASHLNQLGYLDRVGRTNVPTHRWTTTVREVVAGGLPDSLFQPEP